MPVRIQVADDKQVVCPVRFTRAVEGDPVLDAPEIDDRGWNMHRPTGWIETEARGPMVGITVGDTVRVKVVREDIDESTDLYVTVSPESPPQVQIAAPSGGGPLPADGIFSIEALEDNDTGNVIEVRIGSASGPVIAELEPHVFEQLTFRIVPHVVTIHGGGTSGGAAPSVSLNTWFDTARAILRPAGIHLRVDSQVNATLNNGFTHNVPHIASGDFNRMISTGYVADRCNIFFVHTMDQVQGIGMNREALTDPAITFNPPNPAIVIGVEGWATATDGGARPAATKDLTMGNDLAHEIGHFLTLAHAGGAPAGSGRADTFSKRNLMHNQTYPDHGRVRDFGYGREIRGALVTMKRYPFYGNDGQVGRMRSRLLQPNSVKY